jgi:putative glutamine amidotransferase
MSKIVIGITDGRLYENYASWISMEENVELVRLGYKFDNVDEIKRCDGLFMTGGEDVHPKFYHKPEYEEQFNLSDFDEKRDEFEIELLTYWETSQMPLLGVCRGLQLLNVFLGGTLIPDLPTCGKFNHSRKLTEPRYHPVLIDPNSELSSLLKVRTGDVTSIHHQSIDRIGEGLVTNAISPDGVIEGVEWLNPRRVPAMLLVQWHPEAMRDQMSPFSKSIRDNFIKLTGEIGLGYASN